jgi:subtilisin family serine protease
MVRVNDRSGDPVSGVTVSFAVTAGGGGVQGAQATTNTQGTASATWTVGTTVAAPNTATATVTGLAGSPINFTATVQAAPASVATLIQGDSQNGVIGQNLPSQVVVEFHDAFGNLATGQPVIWLVTGGGGSLSGSSISTDLTGRAATSWALGYELGNGHTLRVQVGGVADSVRATAALSPGTTLAIGAGNNQSGLAGQALGAPIGARVETASGHGVAKVPIDWAIATGAGSLTQATSLTDATGLASTGWTLGAGSGPQTVTASNAALSPTSVTLSATAVIPAPSSITGTITLVDSQLTAIRASARGAIPAFREAVRRGVARPRFTPDYTPDELLVRFRGAAFGAPSGLRGMANVAAAEAAGQAIRSRLAVHAVKGRVAIAGVSPVLGAAKVRVSDPAALDSVAQALRADPAVLSVGRNLRWRVDGAPVRPGTIPNDPNFPNQSWHYSMIDLPRAWSITTGSSGVIVAVLDNGVVFHHPAIGAPGATFSTGGGNLRNDGYDFVSRGLVPLCASVGGGSVDNAGDGDGYDNNPSIPDDRDATTDPTCLGARDNLGAHGTHVAGTIGAMGNDGVSVTGVSWSVSIRPVRVVGLQYGDFYDIAQGILYAGGFPADNGAGGLVTPPAQPARIINMSLGGPCPNPGDFDPVAAAIDSVTNPARPNGGVLVVASAGNGASATPSCPAAYDQVLSVAAVGPTGAIASYSNFGGTVDIAAPGGEFAPPADGTWGIFSSVCDFTNAVGNTPPYPLCVPGLARYFGTSMAAPHVSGVAALLLAQNPSLTPVQVRNLLLNYATPVAPGAQIGAGIVNARNALTQTLSPTRQIYARAVDATTGATVATVAAPGGNYALSGLPDGSYFVVAGEDEGGDGAIGIPGRRFGALGGISHPTAVPVSSSAGSFAAFAVGFPVEKEPDDQAANASRLLVDGDIDGSLTAADTTDVFRIVIPTAGTYSFETTGFAGAFCSFALDLNTTLTLLDQNQGPLDQSVDIDGGATANNFCSRITRTLSPGGYYLRVSRGDFFGTGPHAGRYVLEARTGP